MISPKSSRIIVYGLCLIIYINYTASCGFGHTSHSLRQSIEQDSISLVYSNSPDRLESYLSIKEILEEHRMGFVPTSPVRIGQSSTATFTPGRKPGDLSSLSDGTADLDAHFIINNIDRSYAARNKYIWARQFSKEVFNQFVVPYFISDPFIEDWRLFCYSEFGQVVDSLQIGGVVSAREVFKSIRSRTESWLTFNYNAENASEYDGLYKLKQIGQGNCFDYGIIYTYALRTFGIPSTIDYVPFWGSQNGSHAEVVFAQCSNQLKTLDSGRLTRSAKVFRATPAPVNSLILSHYDIPPNLSHFANGHFVDVTGVHNRVSDIKVSIPSQFKYLTPCIYVMNYDRWMPVWFGKPISNQQVVFKWMGRDIIYRIGFYDAIKKHYYLESSPFLLTNEGRIRFSNVNDRSYGSMAIQKINHGDLSWIKRNHFYEIYYLDGKKWIFHSKLLANTDSLLNIDNIPLNLFYKLTSSEFPRMSRIFMYKNGKQHWY